MRPRLSLPLSALTLAALAAILASTPSRDWLAEGFNDPPAAARLRCYWWWLNGNTTAETITRDLEEMKAKGYGGALLVDAGGAEQFGNHAVPAGPMFGSPAWRALYRYAVAEANRLGLEISLNIQSGWNLGGPMVTPEQSAKLLTWSRVEATGPNDFAAPLDSPPANRGFYRDIAVLAYPLRNTARHRPIQMLAFKNASRELGMSMPPTEPLLGDAAPAPHEEDARVTDVEDLTGRMAADGRLQWHVPEGRWEILRVGYTSSGAEVSTSSDTWKGLAIDYMDRGALETYWRQNVAPLLDDVRPYLGRSLKYLVTDSWEVGGINWTARFREEFQRRRGYDLLAYLPIVTGRILNDRATSNRFLNDFRRTVGDLIADEHYRAFAELAERSGLGIHPESGGPHGAPIDALETLGRSTFPQTEFWARSNQHRTRDDERFFVKEAASAAHIYGKTLVAAEGMTSIGPQWEESIWNDLKPTFDQAACEGMNRLVWHTFTSSPKSEGLPGQEYFAGTHLNPNVTWWPLAGAFLGYTNRVQFLLQRGRPVSDVLYYYGDQVPNFVRLKADDPAHVLPGYDYDVASEEVLAHGLTVRDHRIVVTSSGDAPAASYRLLVLPEREAISLEALRGLKQLVADGAAVLGPMPIGATGLQGDSEVRAIAAEMWGQTAGPHSYGEGTVYRGRPAREVLAALDVPPDFEYRGAAPGALDYIHRQAGGTEIYFVRNTRPEAVYAEISLRSVGRAPELWHGDTGTREAALIYDFTSDGRTRMPIWLEPYGSVFVMLRQNPGPHFVTVTRNGAAVFPGEAPWPQTAVRADAGGFTVRSESAGSYALEASDGRSFHTEIAPRSGPIPVDSPWAVSFTPGWGAPAEIAFPKLISWTDHPDPGIRFYSGTAKYSARFRVEAGALLNQGPLRLDLGDVREIAQVRLNGHDLGILWKKPFSVALDNSVLKPGWNELEVSVVNLWPNRLIGDQSLPPEKRLTRTNITKFKADSPLLPSGLLGPVTIEAEAEGRLIVR
jgi:hypothetical protein